jgi:hypothetical protein
MVLERIARTIGETCRNLRHCREAARPLGGRFDPFGGSPLPTYGVSLMLPIGLLLREPIAM